MKLRHVPYWYDRVPASRRPAFPPLRGELETDVAVIGGGLTGCACAYACAAARIPVVLLDPDRVGLDAAGAGAGLVREEFDVPFSAAVTAHGLRTARTLWTALRKAALDLPAALRRLGVTPEPAPQDVLLIANADPAAARSLRREYEARRAAGLEHRWVRRSTLAGDAGLEAGGAIRTRASAIDPYRACLGLARAAAGRGAQVFERSDVRSVRPGRDGVEVATDAAILHARRVVIAGVTSAPELRSLRRHLRSRHGYAVVTEPLRASVRRSIGNRALAVRDSDTPPHVIRWLKDDRVLVEGGDQDPVSPRSAARALVQRTGQLMYELSLRYPAISGVRAEWSWSFPFDDTRDGLPYIGTHRKFPRHLFALGLARHGPAAAWLAARALFRHLNAELAAGDDAFGFSRVL